MKNTQPLVAYENSPFLNFVIDKKYRWIRHFLIIAAIVGVHFLPTREPPETDKDKEVWILFTKFISMVILLAFFYINHYVLIPRLLLRSRFLAYAGSLFGFCSAIFVMMVILERLDLPFIENQEEALLDWKDYLVLLILLMVFIAAVSSLKLFKIWIVNLIRFREFETNTLTIQLEQLKSQINPHFLFNTLNNINFLIDENPKLASKVLLKLSDILRNQLYLSKGDTIELKEEVVVLRNILFMEDIRRDKFVVDFQVEEGLDNVRVPHFLFIPFVENVVKHGAHQAMDNGLHVTISFTREGDRLCFTCINPLKKKANPNDVGGLGLSNIQKRLAIIYPDNYVLEIAEKGDYFKVFLSIPIDDGTYAYG